MAEAQRKNPAFPKVLVIAGSTGTGKSRLAVKLAHLLHGEVISGDSMQVYRGMDIGTAKITKEEMQGILITCWISAIPQIRMMSVSFRFWREVKSAKLPDGDISPFSAAEPDCI